MKRGTFDRVGPHGRLQTKGHVSGLVGVYTEPGYRCTMHRLVHLPTGLGIWYTYDHASAVKLADALQDVLPKEGTWGQSYDPPTLATIKAKIDEWRAQQPAA